MKTKYVFNGHVKFKGKIPGIGKLDINVEYLDVEVEVPDELAKDLMKTAYETGYELGKDRA